VVLADDEEEVLFGIRNNLDWESYGFEVAGDFSNGRDVLEFLQTIDPNPKFYLPV